MKKMSKIKMVVKKLARVNIECNKNSYENDDK